MFTVDITANDYFDTFLFPGGEYGIKWKDYGRFENDCNGLSFALLVRLNSGQDLLRLLTVSNAIGSLKQKIDLVIPYFPGARQDRVTEEGDALTVKVYADVINSLNYKSVCVVDPHSDVTTALINNVYTIALWPYLKQIVEDSGYNTILIPDAGAAKKTFSYYFPNTEFNQKLTFVQCLKKRDTKTGKLSGFRIADKIPDGANCLVVDDIGDGLGTFEGLGKIIRESTINKLGLYVTHGIFSKGTEWMYKTFDEIHTTNSIKDEYEDKKLTVHKII